MRPYDVINLWYWGVGISRQQGQVHEITRYIRGRIAYSLRIQRFATRQGYRLIQRDCPIFVGRGP